MTAEAKRFAHQGMRYSRTRFALSPEPIEGTTGIPHSIVAKLVRGYLFLAAIHPARKRAGILAEKQIKRSARFFAEPIMLGGTALYEDLL